MTGDYVRDSNGFCIPAGVNEPGELIGKIPDETMLSKYTDANATSKKVLYFANNTIIIKIATSMAISQFSKLFQRASGCLASSFPCP